MIDTDDFVEHTGSCKNNCNGCYDDMEKLLAEVKRLREVMIHVEQRQPHPALEWALKEGLTLAEIMERVE